LIFIDKLQFAISGFLVFLLGLVFITQANAETSHALKVEDALQIKSFANCSPIALSPDGLWVAYTIKDFSKQTNQGDKRYEDFTRTGINSQAVGCAVWVTNTKSGQSEVIQEGNNACCSPSWSPDSKSLAFFSDRNGTAQLWLWDLTTHQTRQLSNATIRAFNYQVAQWTPDGKKVIVRVLPKGTDVERAADMLAIGATTVSKEKGASQSGASVSVYGSGVTKANGALTREENIQDDNWLDLNRYKADLAIVDVHSGQTDYIVEQMRPAGSWLSPDGKYLACMHLKGVKRNTRDLIFQMVAVNLTDNSSRLLVDDIQQSFGYNVSWSPDSQSIAYLNTNLNPDGDCYLVSIDGKVQNLTTGKHPQFNYDNYRAPLWNYTGDLVYLISAPEGTDKIWKASTTGHGLSVLGRLPQMDIKEIVSESGGRCIWSPDEGRSLVLGTTDSETKKSCFYSVDLRSGATTKLFEENAGFGSNLFRMDASRHNNILVYVKEEAGKPSDIWVTDTNYKERHRLSEINSKISDTDLGTSIVIDYCGENRRQLHGALLLPAHYEKGRRYPLIVHVYGGLMGSNSTNYFGLSRNGSGADNMQLLASRGYAVLKPDIPMYSADPMSDIIAAVMPAVDRAIELGIADPNRLGVMGHSYGGYSTLALIVQTPRFRTAIDCAGASDLISAYSTLSDTGVSTQVGWCEGGQGRMDGTPWQCRERYIRNSPFFFLDHVQSSLLITHGSLDDAVPCQQSEAVFVGLRRLGKEVVYAKYVGESHSPESWSYDNSLDYCNRMIEWFERHL
jgi:dipeptidyl aminopeptidase/acylaminoacyl peptidase